MNTLNKIPTLALDDGRVLFDSRVICELAYDDTADPYIAAFHRKATTTFSEELTRRPSLQATMPTLAEPIPAGERSA